VEKTSYRGEGKKQLKDVKNEFEKLREKERSKIKLGQRYVFLWGKKNIKEKRGRKDEKKNRTKAEGEGSNERY